MLNNNELPDSVEKVYIADTKDLMSLEEPRHGLSSGNIDKSKDPDVVQVEQVPCSKISVNPGSGCSVNNEKSEDAQMVAVTLDQGVESFDVVNRTGGQPASTVKSHEVDNAVIRQDHHAFIESSVKDSKMDHEENGVIPVKHKDGMVNSSGDHMGMGIESETLLNENDFHIVVNRAAAVTVKAPLLVMGKEVKAVIDTGAEVTVLSESLYNALPSDI